MEYQDDMHAMISLLRLSALESYMYASAGKWGKTWGLNPTSVSWGILYLSTCSCFSKHLHEYVSGTSWYSWLVKRAPWWTAENHRMGFLQIKGPVNSYFPCIHEALQDPPRLGRLQSDDTSDFSAGTDGEERVFCLTGGITGVLVHHKSRIQFANRTTNSLNH